MVYHTIAGKKCIGTTSPGNISGNSSSSGSVTAKGNIIVAKEISVNRKLKIILPFDLKILSNNQKPIPARTQTKIHAPKYMGIVTTDEKSSIPAFAHEKTSA
jgi:hypothetical protein